MKFRVLGCAGSEYPNFHTASFLINDTILLDAGAAASVLSLKEQARLEYILITHTHLDHIKDLMFIADNLAQDNADLNTINVVAPPQVIHNLQDHLFNDKIWPDFTVLPDAVRPAVSFIEVAPYEEFRAGNISARAVPVNHPGGAVGYIIEQDGRSIVYTGDTGPTERIWQEANKVEDLRAVFVEASFPNEMQRLADVSMHLTPRRLAAELEKMRPREVPVYVFHIKPRYYDQVVCQLKELGNPHISILREGEELRF